MNMEYGGGSQPFCRKTKFRKSGRVFEGRKLFLECRDVYLATQGDAEIDRLVLKSGRIKKLKDTWKNSGNLAEAMDQVYRGEKISIDFAVMEKAERYMVESSFDWDDVGEWPAIERHYPKDENGNVFKGEIALDSSGNLTFPKRSLYYATWGERFDCGTVG